MDDKLRAVFAEVFPTLDADWSDSLSPAEVVGWDSFGHLALAEALEREFGIFFEGSDLSEMEDVGHIKAVLERRGATR